MSRVGRAPRATGPSRVVVGCLVTTLVHLGCTSGPQYTTASVAQGLEIVNRSRRDVASVRLRACGGGDWQVLSASAVARGGRFVVPAAPPPPCRDVQALDAAGEVVGEQRGAPVVPGALWELE